MREYRLLGVVALLATLLFGTVQVAAAAVLPLTVDQLASRADAIVIAKVHSNKSRAGKGGHGVERAGIVTDTRLQISRVLKGDRPKEFDLTQPGGELGDTRLLVSDLPEFSLGERCILFLNSDGGVVGGYQGKLEIVDGEVPAMGVSVKDAERRLSGDAPAPVAQEEIEAGVPVGVGDTSPPGYFSITPSTETFETAAPSTEEPQVAVAAAASTLFFEDFESASSGWTVMPPTGAAWGRTTYRAQAGTGSLYCAQTTNPAPGPMPASVSTVYISSSPVNLFGYNAATFECDVWSSMTVNSSNWFNVSFATSASGPWYMPATFVQGVTGGWKHVTVNLASITDYWGAGFKDFTGGPLYIRLTTYHTTGATDEGVYVDNVKVTADNVVTPTIASVSPGSANAGIGTTITIEGADFGATQGTGSVRFLHGAYQNGTTVAASIVSWSDTRIVCTVPRFAESGPITVRADSGASGTWNGFTVGFSAGGPRATSYPARYYINSNTADLANEDAVIQAAFPAWNTCGSNFAVSYAGTTASTSNPPSAMNGMHEIYFASSGFTDSGILAWNYYWYSGSAIVDSNIVFNDAYSWADGAASGKFDLQSVALHEMGHTVGLDDQYGETTEVMGAMPMNATRRALSASEVNGALYVHGAAPDSTPPSTPTVTSSTHPTQAAWYADSSPVVSFVATDASGIGGYSFVIDGSATTVPDTTSEGTATSATFSGLADGEWYFHVRAVDAVGNWGSATHYVLRVDTAAPAVSTDATASYVGTATVSVTATDTHSGVATVEYALDGGAWTEGTSATTSIVGTHTIQARARDIAGNLSEVVSAEFVVLADVEPVRKNYEQTDARITFGGTWATVANSLMSGGSHAYSKTATGAANIRFTGQRIVLVAATNSSFGIMSVRVDGGTPIDVDLYSPAIRYKQEVWDSGRLASGEHTVTIEWTGRRNPAASDTIVALDAVGISGDLLQADKAGIITAYEQTDRNIVFEGVWGTSANTGMSGGSYRYSNTTSNTITVAFAGTRFDWVTAKSSNFGHALVSVDGGAASLVDLYAPSIQYKVPVWSSGTLSDGLHSVTITVAGTKNPASTGTYVGLDRADIVGEIRPVRYEQKHAMVSYDGTWGTSSNVYMSGGDYAFVNAEGAVNVRFNGTSIAWVTLKGANCGRARVYLDGAFAGDVDLYAPTVQYRQTVWDSGVLADGPHSLRIEWAGEKNPASSGTYIGVDAFDCAGALVMRRYEQADALVSQVGTWSPVTNALMSGGGYLYANVSGAVTHVSFTGTRLDWVTITNAAMGIAEVSVDGGTPVEVDLYSSSTAYQVPVWTTGTLANGPHTVAIAWTGRKNPASSGTNVGVDAFDVVGALAPRRLEQTSPAISYSPGWSTSTNTLHSGGSYAYAASDGATATITFTGKRLDWVTIRSSAMGIAEVSVDGGAPVTVDLYSSNTAYRQLVWTTGTLANGPHTVTIRRTGTKNAAASGYYVGIDAFDLVGVTP